MRDGSILATLAQGLAYLRGLNLRPRALERAEQRLRQDIQLGAQLQQEQREQLRDQAFTTLYRNGGDMTKLSPSMVTALGSDIASVRSFAEQMKDAAAGNVSDAAFLGVYGQVLIRRFSPMGLTQEVESESRRFVPGSPQPRGSSPRRLKRPARGPPAGWRHRWPAVSPAR